MRKFKYIFILLMAVGLVIACTDDLELTDPNQLTNDTFFKRPEQLQSSVDAIYANLQTRGLYSRHMFFMNDNMSQESTPNPQHEADKRVYFNFSFNADHGPIFWYWSNCFRGINKANFVIFNEDKFENVTQEQINKSIGEAKFMRALYYFLLVTRFGDVPLYIEETATGQPRAPKADVYAQIIEDLEDASTLLPSRANTDGGRATSGAAFGLLGKAYLYTEQYQLAADAFENVVGYSLTANYIDNFLEETEFNSESLFEVNYTLAFGEDDKWGDAGNGINEVGFRGQEYGWNDWFNSFPSDWLREEFETGDPRYTDSFYSNGETFNNGTMTVEIPLEREVAWKKYQNYYKQPNENQASGINMRVLRYADVLLMWAEAENELGNSAQAISLMNQVRDRVGMPNYGSAEMNTTFPVSNQQQIFDAIVHERIVELAGEWTRFNDLVRWDMAETELSGTGFVKGVHEVFPIPQAEINENPSLSEADQNPGY